MDKLVSLPTGATPLSGLAEVASWLAFATATLLLARHFAAKDWRARFALGWTILASFAAAGVAHLDGGLESPMMLLLFLPVAFAAPAFSPRAAAGCGLACLASAAVVTRTGSATSLPSGVILVHVARPHS